MARPGDRSGRRHRDPKHRAAAVTRLVLDGPAGVRKLPSGEVQPEPEPPNSGLASVRATLERQVDPLAIAGRDLDPAIRDQDFDPVALRRDGDVNLRAGW